MSIKKRIQNIGKNIYVEYVRLRYGIENKVLFISFDGRQYSDNPRAVSEKLHELYPEIKIEWLIKDPADKCIPNYVEVKTPKNKWDFYKLYATSKVVLTNFSLPNIKKSSRQFFIQTWHGDRAFKKIQYDNPFIKNDFFRPESQPGFCDLCVAGSDYGEKKFRSAFKYEGEILKVGTPRDDKLVNASSEEIDFLKKKLSVPSDTKILLYAPTIRKNKLDGMEVKDLDVNRTLKKLEEKYQCNWICFMRSHPGVKGLSGVEYNEKVIDVSKYEDMADLLLISDMLITDYSSSAGDYALLGRPLVLFHSDKKEYMENERTFYFPIEESPYYVANNQNELEKIIESFTDFEIQENSMNILDFYGNRESGNASVIISKIINCKISGKVTG